MFLFIILLILVPNLTWPQSDAEILNKWTNKNESMLIQKYTMIASPWFETECLKLAKNLQFQHINHCQIFDSKIINAYVFNNGHVYFSTGMMKQINNYNQWAAILAHENAHIALHHYLSMLKKIRKPNVFFPKSNIRKMLIRHESEADNWSKQRLKAHDMDYSQINYFFERMKGIKSSRKNNHLKLSKRIKKANKPEIMDMGLIQKIKEFIN